MILAFLSELVHPGWLWMLLGVILLVLELTMPGLFLFFFGLGALLTGVLVFLLPLGFSLQLLIFSVLSVAMLLTLRRLLKPVLYRKGGSGQDSDEVVGRMARVVEDIAPPAGGVVEFQGSRWAARAENSIAVGTWVSITKRDNLTLHVQPASNPET